MGETHELRLVWPLECQLAQWRARPTSLAAHVLGHEGPNSATARLRAPTSVGVRGFGVEDWCRGEGTIERVLEKARDTRSSALGTLDIIRHESRDT